MFKYIGYMILTFILGFQGGNAIGELVQHEVTEDWMTWVVGATWFAIAGVSLYLAYMLFTKHLIPETFERWGDD